MQGHHKRSASRGPVSTGRTRAAPRVPLAGLALAGAALCAAPASAPAEEPPTTSTISPALLPARPGASAGFKITVKFAGGEFGMPSQVTHVTLHMAAGLRYQVHGLKVCPGARLKAHGLRGCPADTRIGAGHALMGAHLGASNITEEAQIWAFLGPVRNGLPSIELLGQGETPLEESVVLTGVWQRDQAPYGARIDFSVPPIPTVPLEPSASTISFSLEVGGARHAHGRAAVILPRKCPAGGLPFAADFSYANGTSSRSTARVPCR